MFLRADSPPPTLIELETLPIFPRDRRTGRKEPQQEQRDSCVSMCLQSLASVSQSWLSPVEVKDEDEDLANEHLAVVDGWCQYNEVLQPTICTHHFVHSVAFRMPSPVKLDTPSLASDSSGLDELFLPSSSDQSFGEEFSPIGK